jgi:hypothetical protein
LFEGEEGLLFGVTDNLSSGTIFSVSDISGLTAIEYDASGDLKLGEYANSTTLYADRGVYLASGIPTNTTNAVYISGGALHFNGSALGGGSSYNDAPISGYFESRVDQADSDIATVSGLLYDDAAISGYFESRVDSADSSITANSGYFESRVDSADSSITANSGYFESRVDSADSSITANSGYFESRVDQADSDIATVSGLLYDDAAISGYFESRVDQNAADIVTVSGLAGGSSYTAGSGLTLVGTEFNVYGGSGNFQQIDVTSDNTFTPKMVFTGSGVTDTPIRMKVLSSHASASTSGTALAFEGTEGQLFGITDNLSSGTIFSVNDITGLPLISANASGDVKLAEFGRDLIAHKPITIESGVPSTTTNKLYNDGYKLNFDGATLPKSDPVAGASGIHNMMVMSQATYDALGTKDPNTLYYIV